MLTTIQERVMVGDGGTIVLHTRGFKVNTRLSVVAVVEPEDGGVAKRRAFTPRDFYGLGNSAKNEIDAYLAAVRSEWN